MKKSSVLIRIFGVLVVLGVPSGSVLVAEESVIRITDRQTSNSTISAENLETFALLSLKRIYFGFEDSNLSVEEKDVLDGLLTSLPRGKQSAIELRGYTDGIESAETGIALGATRSQTIARYLVANGISPQRILVVSLNAISDEEKSMNPEHRRVDIRVFVPEADLHDTPSAVNRTRQLAASKTARGF
jgi:outer membrane protein OmpA-like peptidoglycan-associated protein